MCPRWSWHVWKSFFLAIKALQMDFSCWLFLTMLVKAEHRKRSLFSFYFPLLLFRRTIQFRKNLCTILLVWLSCCFFLCAKGKKWCVLSGLIHDPLWMLRSPKWRGGWTPPCREGLIPTGAAASSQLPQFLQNQRGPKLTLCQHIW